jgi:hypothetical protein
MRGIVPRRTHVLNCIILESPRFGHLTGPFPSNYLYLAVRGQVASWLNGFTFQAHIASEDRSFSSRFSTNATVQIRNERRLNQLLSARSTALYHCCHMA